MFLNIISVMSVGVLGALFFLNLLTPPEYLLLTCLKENKEANTLKGSVAVERYKCNIKVRSLNYKQVIFL